jgi:hypothetical protein
MVITLKLPIYIKSLIKDHPFALTAGAEEGSKSGTLGTS